MLHQITHPSLHFGIFFGFVFGFDEKGFTCTRPGRDKPGPNDGNLVSLQYSAVPKTCVARVLILPLVPPSACV